MDMINKIRRRRWILAGHIRRIRHNRGSGGRAVERRTVNRGDGGSIPPTAVSKLKQCLHPTFACVFRKRH